MSKTRFLSLAAILAFAAPAFAAETFEFDKSHSTVGFQVRHIFTMLSGRFTDYTGAIQVDRARPESSTVEFTIQATSIDTAEPRRDQHLRAADFFDVATHPTITFKSTSVKPNGKDSFLVTGELTMRGVTRQVTLPVTLLGEGKDPWGNEKMGLETSVTLNRRDFGLVWNKALETGGVLVGEEVKVQIAIEANKAKPPAAPAAARSRPHERSPLHPGAASGRSERGCGAAPPAHFTAYSSRGHRSRLGAIGSGGPAGRSVAMASATWRARSAPRYSVARAARAAHSAGRKPIGSRLPMSVSPPGVSSTCSNTALNVAPTRAVGAQVHMRPPGFRRFFAASKNSTE